MSAITPSARAALSKLSEAEAHDTVLSLAALVTSKESSAIRLNALQAGVRIVTSSCNRESARHLLNMCRIVLRTAISEEEQEGLLLIREGKLLVEQVKEHVAFEPGMPIAVSTWDAPPEEATPEAKIAWERANN